MGCRSGPGCLAQCPKTYITILAMESACVITECLSPTWVHYRVHDPTVSRPDIIADRSTIDDTIRTLAAIHGVGLAYWEIKKPDTIVIVDPVAYTTALMESGEYPPAGAVLTVLALWRAKFYIITQIAKANQISRDTAYRILERSGCIRTARTRRLDHQRAVPPTIGKRP
jgi:hypothetical protein